MDWIELIVHTTTEGAESVSFELIELGSAGTMIEDRADIPDPGKQYLTDLLYATNVFTMLFNTYKQEYEKQLQGTTP